MKRILIVVGTRPNFVKVTQFKKVGFEYPDIDIMLAHTGQHYERNLSEVFFRQFDLVPDYFLNVAPGTPASQIAGTMVAVEQLINEYRPDLVLVPGDVNSTVATALAANKCGVALGHIESGLRSFDRTMPEEHNRVVTDALADMLFVTEASGRENLLREGRDDSDIHFVGNTMIDTLVATDEQIRQSQVLDELGIKHNDFVLATFHRPSNVDSISGQEQLVRLLTEVCSDFQVVFPVHPRTRKNLGESGLWRDLERLRGLILTEPLDYFCFQKLILHCSAVITDSGGIQEETTFRGVPCFTLRENTERPVTVQKGTNQLTSWDPALIRKRLRDLPSTERAVSNIDLWDGQATHRILEVIERGFSS